MNSRVLWSSSFLWEFLCLHHFNSSADGLVLCSVQDRFVLCVVYGHVVVLPWISSQHDDCSCALLAPFCWSSSAFTLCCVCVFVCVCVCVICRCLPSRSPLIAPVPTLQAHRARRTVLTSNHSGETQSHSSRRPTAKLQLAGERGWYYRTFLSRSICSGIVSCCVKGPVVSALRWSCKPSVCIQVCTRS